MAEALAIVAEVEGLDPFALAGELLQPAGDTLAVPSGPRGRGRHPAGPTLTQIDPRAMRADVIARIADHISAYLQHVAPVAPDAWRVPTADEMASLGAEIEWLAAYAQRGLPVGDWTHHGMASDALVRVLGALYPSVLGETPTAIDVVDDIDPSDDVGLVLVAAAARIRIDRGEPVTARELGALAGIGAYAVRHHLRSGALRATDERPARVQARDARRWLAARGVPGFGR